MTEPHIQLLDEIGDEFARVAAESGRATWRSRVRDLAATPRRAVALALSGLAVLGGAAYAVPPTRAAIDDLTNTFADWVGGDDEQAPGTPAGSDAPSWVREDGGRLIAESAGVPLYVTRRQTEDGTILEFTLGGEGGAVIGASVEGWRERFDEHTIVVLGWTPFGGETGILDERGRVPLLGVTGRSVDQVELRYEQGPPLTATGLDGGFVLIVDAWRPLRALVAYDAAGRELERADLGHLDLRYLCEREPGCLDGP